MTTPPLIHEDFLLQSDAAQELYHDYAKRLPVIDYHCHLSPAELSADRSFRNLTDIWLSGDHYKWRAMRADGVAEQLITGNATDREKFDAYAGTVPLLLKNPLYHWTHMELADPFGIRDRVLSPDTADYVWESCNDQLATPGFTPRGLVQHFNVQLICTTDDPADSLEHHRALAQDASFPVTVLPTFRPDKALAIENPEIWNAYIDRLGASAGVDIRTWDDLLSALSARARFFASHGCRLADCGIPEPYAKTFTLNEVRAAFDNARSGQTPDPAASRRYRSALLHELGVMYHEMDWTSQLHIGALRNVNTRFAKSLGADSGHDSIGDQPMATGLGRMLDRLDAYGRLPRTILFNLNPADNELFAAMAGCFQEGPTAGKVQYGPPWWFLDSMTGFERQFEALGNMGILAHFVGMTTDSRSFLSYPRHDYFRRVLCNVLGRDIEQGLIPRDFAHVGGIVTAMCHGNARSYFGFKMKHAPELAAAK